MGWWLTGPVMFAFYVPFLTWKVDRSLLCLLQRDIDEFKRKQMQPGSLEALSREANAFLRAISRGYFVHQGWNGLDWVQGTEKIYPVNCLIWSTIVLTDIYNLHGSSWPVSSFYGQTHVNEYYVSKRSTTVHQTGQIYIIRLYLPAYIRNGSS